MYSRGDAPESIIDTFAARTLPKNGSSTAPDKTMEYMQRTGCNIDTLLELNAKKERSSLFIV